MELFLKQDANIRAVDSLLGTPLATAARSLQYEMVKFLLAHGAGDSIRGDEFAIALEAGRAVKDHRMNDLIGRHAPKGATLKSDLWTQKYWDLKSKHIKLTINTLQAKIVFGPAYQASLEGLIDDTADDYGDESSHEYAC